ncbi:hypothetical protein POM88_041294 [Heracleum sosnowskyi]|uniref:Ubiquitin-like protease family profile domain-containing protein n=1 Tax=Heracleum sosnowskyi TaxID=360622 RepID=A0AAD8MB89_9APIA|nr:hypothetical protein POM88_041294 [Heracleum sosnowskyi]
MRFEKNLNELKEVYDKCLDNFEVAFALYPKNARLGELKEKYSLFFKLFGDSSPISKMLFVGYNDENDKTHFGEAGEEDFVPKFSLGILRPRRGIKASHFCRSPYVSRVVDVSTHQITTEERNVWEWLFHTRRDVKKCTSGHFQSMKENSMIEATIIDTWSYLLNENGILRDNCSPLRLFMTSKTTHRPLIMEVGEGTHDKMERYAVFHDNMDIVVQMVCDMHTKQYEVKDFDMFCFPIYSSEHHYVIYYNMKKPKLEILDNWNQTGEVEDIYGDLPARLTEENAVDCGAFVMRHMETYVGNLYKWKVGLRLEKDNQRPLLNKLRIIYCHGILTWTENIKNDRIVATTTMVGKGVNINS